MPFWLLPCATWRCTLNLNRGNLVGVVFLSFFLSKPPSTPHLQQVQHARFHGELRRAHDHKANKREVHLIEVKYCEDTRTGHQLEASSNQHETLCRRLKAKKVTLHTILLGVGYSIHTSNTLHHLKELDHKGSTKLTLNCMLTLCIFAYKLTTTRRALEVLL